MFVSGSLRQRIVAANVLLATVVCAFFAAAAYFTIQAIEDKLINERLSEAIDLLIERHERGLSTDSPVGPSLLHGTQIPAGLRALPPGLHEVQLEGRVLHAMVRDRRGDRFVVVDDDSEFARMEVVIFLALGAGLAGCVLLAGVLGWVTASRAIAPVTALVRAVENDALAEASAALASPDEIGVLARAFAARTAELRQFLVRERLFTGDVSHELRTPLTVILGAAELLEARLQDRPDLLPVVTRVARTAQEAAERVSALLLLSRSPETVDAPRTPLAALLRQEMERCSPLLAGKPVAMTLEAPAEVWVFARPELVSIAIGNLLRNACQFTEQGEVTVRLGARALSVEDSGPGVPPSVRSRLFERFVRASDDTTTGSGLGLAIAKRVAEHLGWRLELKDGPGGSCFVLHLRDAP